MVLRGVNIPRKVGLARLVTKVLPVAFFHALVPIAVPAVGPAAVWKVTHKGHATTNKKRLKKLKERRGAEETVKNIRSVRIIGRQRER